MLFGQFGQLREHHRVLVSTEERALHWESEDLGAILESATNQIYDFERYRPVIMPKVYGRTQELCDYMQVT